MLSWNELYLVPIERELSLLFVRLYRPQSSRPVYIIYLSTYEIKFKCHSFTIVSSEILSADRMPSLYIECCKCEGIKTTVALASAVIALQVYRTYLCRLNFVR